MANFASIFRGASSQSDLASDLNNALKGYVVSEMLSSSMVHTSGGSNKGALVFALGTGDLLKVTTFQDGSMGDLESSIQAWSDTNKYELVQVAINYDNGNTRVLLIYKENSESDNNIYKVTCISDDTPSGMQGKVDTAIQDCSLVISDTVYASSKDRAILFTQP